MDDRKLLTADFNNLKVKIKAEMLRRAYSGSVAGYGGSAYDFSMVPADRNAVLGEHLAKNLVAMKAVNAAGLPGYPGALSEAGQHLMETRILAWSARGIEDHAASDCQSGCTGTCFSSCQTGCYSGCNGCSGCGSGCAGDCDGSCSRACATCTGACDTSCTGCSGTCQSGCTGDCERTCSGGCSSCSGCGGSCKAVCASSCSGSCGSSCSSVDC